MPAELRSMRDGTAPRHGSTYMACLDRTAGICHVPLDRLDAAAQGCDGMWLGRHDQTMLPELARLTWPRYHAYLRAQVCCPHVCASARSASGCLRVQHAEAPGVAAAQNVAQSGRLRPSAWLQDAGHIGRRHARTQRLRIGSV